MIYNYWRVAPYGRIILLFIVAKTDLAISKSSQGICPSSRLTLFLQLFREIIVSFFNQLMTTDV